MVHWLMVKLLFLELLFVSALVGALLGALVFFKKPKYAWAVAVLAFAGMYWFDHSRWGAGRDVGFIVAITGILLPLPVSFKVHEWLVAFGRRFNDGADSKPVDILRHLRQPSWVATFIVMTVVFVVLDSSVLSRVRDKVQSRERDETHLHVRMGDVTEIGHITGVSREINYGTWDTNIRWWVKIAGSGDVYYCDWDGGYSGFSKGDDVEFIHTKSSDMDAMVYGYLVERHSKEQGHTASVEGSDISDF